MSDQQLPRSVSTSLSDPAPPYEYALEQESRDYMPLPADQYASSADNNQNGGYSYYYASADIQDEYERSLFAELRQNDNVPRIRQAKLQIIHRGMYLSLDNPYGDNSSQSINQPNSQPEASAVEQQPASTSNGTESRNSSMPLENSIPREYLMYRKGYFF